MSSATGVKLRLEARREASTSRATTVSRTYLEQEHVEDIVEPLFLPYEDEDTNLLPILLREKHVEYLRKALKHLPRAYECLDASQPWLIYWILHSLTLLEEPIDEEQAEEVTSRLTSLQYENGGFCGGPGQQPHLAPTYAAVNALATLSIYYPKALDVINRKSLTNFLLKMRLENGSFKLEDDGEADSRGAYCAASVAVLTNLDVRNIFSGTAEWISTCQTYEGGFAGVPGMEAHGGYTFCSFSALVLLGHSHMCDVTSLLRWTVNRQMRFEGGFQGRTNKLVDGCYSFWQASVLAIIQNIMLLSDDKEMEKRKWLFDSVALQEYIIICCQQLEGGLLDKPGRAPDYYHTCYCLSGLSLAQHFESGSLYHQLVVGDAASNKLAPIHPLHNITVEAVKSARSYFTTTHLVDED